MNELLPFVVIGITTGSIYGLAAMGLVLSYKTSGIFNFAHGSIAAVAAFAFYDLHIVRGLPWPVALVIAVVVLPPLLALLMERITRVLATGTATSKIVATLGLQLAITSALVARYGGAGLDFPAFLPTDTVEVAGINVGIDQLISTIVAAGAAIGFFVFFKISPLGTRMRAVVDNPDLLALAGTSPFVVRSWAWLIGCHFAAISGILLAPQIGLDALLLTLLVVQAYGAAAVGLFTSLPLTYAGGVLVGVLAALATNVASGSDVLAGLPPALPFLVLFAVLLLVPPGKLVEPGGHRPSTVPTPLVGPSGAKLLAIGLIGVGMAIPFLVGAKLPVYANALVFVLIFSSLHLLVRTSGQVSLAHAALVAVGASTFSHLAVGAGLPWLVAVLLAGLVAVPVGALVAIPAIRLSGLYLALATFGFGLLLEKVFYRSDVMFGAGSTLPAPRPPLFEGDAAFYYLLLAFAVGGVLLMTVIGRSRLGRLLRAMADSPTTLSTLGLGVNITRVTVFAISAFIAGVAGALYAAQGQSATGTPFISYASLTWLAILVLCAGARSAAPIAAAVGLVVVPAYITDETVVAWLPVLFGIGALVVALREAAATGRRSSPGDAEFGARSGSRAAERIGSAGAGAERLRDEAARAARRAAPGAARLKVGSAR
ncbi:MAG: ABC transporter permease subunit [Haloechinothrix sp.]